MSENYGPSDYDEEAEETQQHLSVWDELPDKAKKRVSQQRKYFREQFWEMVRDARADVPDSEKTVLFESDGITYKTGVPLFPGDKPLRIDHYTFQSYQYKRKRLAAIWARLTANVNAVEVWNFDIHYPFQKCPNDDCYFTYITSGVLKQHMSDIHYNG